MKKTLIRLIIFTMVIHASALFAQRSVDSMQVERAKKNYLQGLSYNVDPLVESAIFNVMALRQYFPQHDYSAIAKRLAELSQNSPNATVRYKAFLAVQFMENPDWFGPYDFINREDRNVVFQDISQKISGRLFGLGQ